MKQDSNNSLKVLLKKEMLIALKTPSAYVVIIVFLLISGYMFADGLFLSNVATLRPFFTLTGILFLFFRRFSLFVFPIIFFFLVHPSPLKIS